MIDLSSPKVNVADLNAEIALYVKHEVIKAEEAKGLRKNADKVEFITNLYEKHGVILEVNEEVLKDHKELIASFVEANPSVDLVEAGHVLLIDKVAVENYLGATDTNTPEPPQAPEEETKDEDKEEHSENVKKEAHEVEDLVYQRKTVVFVGNRLLSGTLYKLVKVADGTEYTLTKDEFEELVKPRA